jgi:hypothetical protein
MAPLCKAKRAFPNSHTRQNVYHVHSEQRNDLTIHAMPLAWAANSHLFTALHLILVDIVRTFKKLPLSSANTTFVVLAAETG